MSTAASDQVRHGVRWGWIGLNSLRVLAYGYLALVAGLYFAQRKLVFMPDPAHVAPASVGLTAAREITLQTPDGERLVAWWTPPKAGNVVVLDLQGQGGAPSWRAGTIRYFTDAGYGVLTLAYRGYGGSTGSPSEPALISDAKLAYDWLRGRGIEDRRIVLFGESLGTGVAVQVAADRPVAGVILDSAYTSLVDVAQGRFPFVPVVPLMSDPFNSMAYIGRVTAPLLMIHGTDDRVVPYQFGQRLFASANEPKRLVTIPGGGHTVHFSQGPWAAIKPFLDGIASRSRLARIDAGQSRSAIR